MCNQFAGSHIAFRSGTRWRALRVPAARHGHGRLERVNGQNYNMGTLTHTWPWCTVVKGLVVHGCATTTRCGVGQKEMHRYAAKSNDVVSKGEH